MQRALCFLLSLLLAGCSLAGQEEETETFTFDFSEGLQGWQARFADYPAGEAERFELASDYRFLPAPLDTTEGSLFITGSNLSDDLFMFFKRQVRGLRANTSYRVQFEVKIATNEPHGCAGVGGAPGRSVFVKAGAVSREPRAVVSDEGYYRLNIDKGNQKRDSPQTRVPGHIANSQDCSEENISHELKTLETEEPIQVTTDAQGTAWIFVGTESGFEATTHLYYDAITARFTQA